MIVIDNKETIHVNRGDMLLLDYSIEDYTFVDGDVISFGIYKKTSMNQKPVLYKEYKATAGATNVEIFVSSEEMKIEDYINRPKEYWYEIQLNSEETTTGYDQIGAKKLMLYPEGMVPDVNS